MKKNLIELHCADEQAEDESDFEVNDDQSITDLHTSIKAAQ